MVRRSPALNESETATLTFLCGSKFVGLSDEVSLKGISLDCAKCNEMWAKN